MTFWSSFCCVICLSILIKGVIPIPPAIITIGISFFAGKTKLNIQNGWEIRVDIDENMPADYHMDAFDFVETYVKEKFNTIVLDPPYNLRKAREKYAGRYIGSFTKIKKALPKILVDNGRIITLGYNSVGFPRDYGFIKKAICLVCHGGDHNDTIGIVEERIIGNLL